MALNEGQRQFCLEYIIDFNGQKAAERAGYKKNAARVQASQLLTKPNVQEEIRKLMGERQKRTKITGDRVVQEIANIAFAHMGLVCVQEEKTGNLRLMGLDEMEEGALATLESIQENRTHDKDGKVATSYTRFRMHDKLKALELLSKHLGLLDGQGAGKKDSAGVKDRLRDAIGAFGKRVRSGSSK